MLLTVLTQAVVASLFLFCGIVGACAGWYESDGTYSADRKGQAVDAATVVQNALHLIGVALSALGRSHSTSSIQRCSAVSLADVRAVSRSR